MRHLVKLAVLILLMAAPRAGAIDGVVEINQASALAGGVTSGDLPGFPVTLSESGSYRLTGHLQVSVGKDGINVAADDVWLDLNGFSVLGPNTGTGIGIGLATFAPLEESPNRVTLRNGEVMGMGIGVALGDDALLENMALINCANAGAILGARSLLLSNRSAGSCVVRVGADSYFADNVFAAVFSFIGGRTGIPAGGSNFCADGGCSPRAARFYYLTANATYDGAEAANACRSGFHMASLFEISSPGDLEYRRLFGIGLSLADSGEGAPAESGWVRTGQSAYLGNCQGFTSNSNADQGVIVKLHSNWSGGSRTISPWQPDNRVCNEGARVWCVQD